RHFGATDPSLKDKLDAVFNAINESYATLVSSRRKTARPGPFTFASEKKMTSASFPERGQVFKQGIEEFKKGDFQKAADLFKSNVDSEPGNAKYWSYLSLALTRLGGRALEAENAMLEAARLEPGCADHYANLGLIYSREGLTRKARESFEKALRIEPGNMKAQKGIEKLRG
ncbi:MAG TPA: tetratricopeptide repeat protein, partial [Thermodesulfovibrionales bacterium]|nr:tetratricopeptide repeat protein [Thermodesulfovibrionales bacterium]